MDSELRGAFSRIFRSAQAATFVRAKLGSGQEVPDPFTVPGYPERTYCVTANGTLVAAITNGISLVRNADVILIPVPTQAGEEVFEVLRFDPDRLRDLFGENARRIQAGYGGLGFGNEDYIESLRLMHGLVVPVSGLTFRALPFSYRWHGVRRFYDGALTVTITAPTTTSPTPVHRWTLIGYNPDTDTLTSANGAEYPISAPVGGAELAAISFTGIPLMGVLLNTADTGVTGLDRFRDARELIGTDSPGLTPDEALFLAW